MDGQILYAGIRDERQRRGGIQASSESCLEGDGQGAVEGDRVPVDRDDLFDLVHHVAVRGRA